MKDLSKLHTELKVRFIIPENLSRNLTTERYGANSQFHFEHIETH